MRQGGSPPTGKWVGSPQGGVESPDPIILPNATERFVKTGARLDALATDHAMSNWLAFMATLSRAQEIAAAHVLTSGSAPAGLGHAAIDLSSPLTILRERAWRECLLALLDAVEGANVPEAAKMAVGALCGKDDDDVRNLASCVLSGAVGQGEVAVATYIAAALQAYLTALASTLDVAGLTLHPERGRCPCCGSTPLSGIVTATGKAPGARYLYCSLCSTAWNYVRAVCVTCGESRNISIRGIEGDSGLAKAETCDACSTYAKMFYQAKDMQVDAYADDLASLRLDIMIAEAGWSRRTPNPILIVA